MRRRIDLVNAAIWLAVIAICGAAFVALLAAADSLMRKP